MLDEETREFTKDFRQRLSKAHRYCWFTRGLELQEKQVGKLRKLLVDVQILKTKEIDKANEEGANYLLGLELICESIIHQLKIYILLKSDQMDKAWDELVEAQMQAERALDLSTEAEFLKEEIKKIAALETSIYPKMQFCSVGFLTKDSRCSICNSIYGECNHVKGKAYMGRICAEIIEKADLQEVSLVDNPANRHARITSFGEGNRRTNYLTLRREEGPS